MDMDRIIEAVERMETIARTALQAANEIRAEIGEMDRPKKSPLTQKQIDGLISKRLKNINK